MKTKQKKNILEFDKNSIYELNTTELNNINGGISSMTKEIGSSIVPNTYQTNNQKLVL